MLGGRVQDVQNISACTTLFKLQKLSDSLKKVAHENLITSVAGKLNKLVNSIATLGVDSADTLRALGTMVVAPVFEISARAGV